MNNSANINVLGPMHEGYDTILSSEALAFISGLAEKFTPRIKELIAYRQELQQRLDAGGKFDFLPETADIRAGDWTVAPLPDDLQDRRVEITGPVDRKMIINALNSGASCFMADFEDACSPTWDNIIQGQLNLRDAIAGTIEYVDPTTNKHYALKESDTTLLVRPRHFEQWEKHVLLNGEPIAGCLFDLGLYLFHNAKALLAKGSGPYFYLPKMESRLEARLLNDVFVYIQDKLGIPNGTIKGTVLIETLPASFEMDEILYELRDHSSGLNCGRWDYIFSFIKKQRNNPDSLMPDRAQVTMTQHCMHSYVKLLIKTCHRQNVHAMGGMAAQIPVKDDPVTNESAMEKVRADKLREVQDGHDGTWVAHPGLIPIAKEIFDEHMPGLNQIDLKREDVEVTAADLLEIPTGTRTDEGLRSNIRVGVQYIEAWLSGLAAVPVYNLMEDAATAEISRTQVWQWIHYQATLDDGQQLSKERFLKTLDEEMQQVRSEVGNERFDNGRFDQARELFQSLCLADELDDFLTSSAYERLLANKAVEEEAV